MKKNIFFLLLICSQFLFSQKKILLFSPESYQYKVQSEFVKKNKVNTITVFYQHEFVKGNHLDEKLLISSIEKKILNKKATGYASLDWEGEALRAVTDHTEASDFYMKQMIKAIKVAKKMRPNVKWAYFDLPVMSFVTKNGDESNENLMPLYKELDYLSPSFYLYFNNTFIINQFYASNAKSILKIAKKLNKPVLPYIWNRFHPNNGDHAFQLIPDETFDTYLKSFLEVNEAGKKIDGVIWWHSEYYTYLNKKENKKQVEAYKEVKDIETYLNQVFNRYYKRIKSLLK